MGRLDRDTTGLIILTNENGWIHPLTHPSFRHTMRYEVVVQGMPSEEMVTEVCAGLTLEGVKMQPCKMSVIDTDRASGLTLLDITLDESKPQQIQLIMEHLQCPAVSMKRVEFGTLKLGQLRRGQWREMTAAEITKLKESCEPATTEKPVRTVRKSRSGYGGTSFWKTGDSRDTERAGRGGGGRGATRVFGGGGRGTGATSPVKRPGSGYAQRTGTVAEGGQRSDRTFSSINGDRGRDRGGRGGGGGGADSRDSGTGRGGDNRGRVWSSPTQE